MSEIEFPTPAFLADDITSEDSIHERMLYFLADRGIDVTEGGFAWDMTRPAAAEIAQGYEKLIEAIQIMFPMWAYSGWLDLHGLVANVERKAAVCASGTLTITGNAGYQLAKGYQFATPATDGAASVIFALDEAVTIPASGSIDATATCLSEGTVGNVIAGMVSMMVTPTRAITSVTNASAFSGGAEEESDYEYSYRIMDAYLSVTDSLVGNPADYKRWALEVSGVGDAVVVPVWNGAGTVKLVLVDESGAPANQALLTAVYDHIMSDGSPNNRLAPIGCELTVVAPTSVSVNVAATVTLDADATASGVQTAFEAALAAYFATAKRDGIIRCTKIGALLGGVDGVEDYANLLVNGGAANILIAEDNYPVCGTIEVTSA